MAKKKKHKGPFQKQKASVYTMMIICAFLALLLASVLMYMELERYKWDTEAKEYKRADAQPYVTTTLLA